MATITPTRQDLERLVRGYVAIGSELDSTHVVPVAQMSPRHEDPYCVVGLVRNNRIGYPEERVRFDGSGNIEFVETISVRQARYDVNFYRETTHAELFADWMQSAEGVIQAGKRNFRIKQYGDIIRMDDLIEDRWEYRSVVMLEVVYNSIFRDTSRELEVDRIIISHDQGTEEVPLDDSA